MKIKSPESGKQFLWATEDAIYQQKLPSGMPARGFCEDHPDNPNCIPRADVLTFNFEYEAGQPFDDPLHGVPQPQFSYPSYDDLYIDDSYWHYMRFVLIDETDGSVVFETDYECFGPQPTGGSNPPYLIEFNITGYQGYDNDGNPVHEENIGNPTHYWNRNCLINMCSNSNANTSGFADNCMYERTNSPKTMYGWPTMTQFMEDGILKPDTSYKLEVRGGIKPMSWEGNNPQEWVDGGGVSEGCYEYGDTYSNGNWNCWGAPTYDEATGELLTEQIWLNQDLPDYAGNVDDGSPCFEQFNSSGFYCQWTTHSDPDNPDNQEWLSQCMSGLCPEHSDEFYMCCPEQGTTGGTAEPMLSHGIDPESEEAVIAVVNFTMGPQEFACLNPDATNYDPLGLWNDENLCEWPAPHEEHKDSQEPDWPLGSDEVDTSNPPANNAEESPDNPASTSTEQPPEADSQEDSSVEDSVEDTPVPEEDLYTISATTPMGDISNRIFGSDIPLGVKRKLEARQYLASGTKNPNDAIQSRYKGEGVDTGPEYYKLSDEALGVDLQFQGAADLSSRTPWARMWTGVQVNAITHKNNWPVEDDENNERTVGNLYKLRRGRIWEYEKSNHERMIYEIGNNNTNILDWADPNNPRTLWYEKGDTEFGHGNISDLLPYPGDSQLEYFTPPAGITGVNSETEGSMGEIRKTTVNFIVHSFQDFENIYQRFFLRPGAQIFVDYGWSSQELYDPKSIIFDEKNEPLEKHFYGADGIVTKAAGDMESFNGYVINYDSKYLENGSVECSVELISKNGALMSGNFNNFKEMKNLIVESLDAKCVNYAAKHWGKEYHFDNKNYTLKDLEGLSKVVMWFASSNLSDVDNDPDNFLSSANALKTGVYFRGLHSVKNIDELLEDVTDHLKSNITGEESSGTTKVENTENLYINFGLMEDMIFNTELAVSSTWGDGDEKNLPVQFDSSNSFMTYNKQLRRMMASNPDKAFAFLYPKEYRWSYNAIRNKVPTDRKVVDWNTGKKDAKSTKDKMSRRNVEGAAADEKWWDSYDYKNNRIPIREIFVNMKTIKKAIRGKQTVKQMMKAILSDISKETQDICDLQTSSNKKANNEIAIVDINYVWSERQNPSSFLQKLFTFSPYSANSIIQSFDINFNMPSDDIGNMIALQSEIGTSNIKALDSVTDSILAASVTEKLREGLDQNQMYGDGGNIGISYLPEPSGIQAQKFAKKSGLTIDMESAHFDDTHFFGGDTARYQNFLTSMEGAGTYDYFKRALNQWVDTIVNMKNQDNEEEGAGAAVVSGTPVEENYYPDDVTLVKTIDAYFAKLAKNNYFSDITSTIVPVELSLSMYGCGLLQPGDIFKVDHLPARYRELVYFQIKNVKHEISESGWITTLETFMRVSTSAKKKSGQYAGGNVFMSVKALGSTGQAFMDGKALSWTFSGGRGLMVANFKPRPYIKIFNDEHSDDYFLKARLKDYQFNNYKDIGRVAEDDGDVYVGDIYSRNLKSSGYDTPDYGGYGNGQAIFADLKKSLIRNLIPLSIKGAGKKKNTVRQYQFKAARSAVFLNQHYVSSDWIYNNGMDSNKNKVDNLFFGDYGDGGICDYGITWAKISDGPKLQEANGPMTRQFYSRGAFQYQDSYAAHINWSCYVEQNKQYRLIVSKAGNWVITPMNMHEGSIEKITNIFFWFEKSSITSFGSVYSSPYNNNFDPGGWCKSGGSWGPEHYWEGDCYGASGGDRCVRSRLDLFPSHTEVKKPANPNPSPSPGGNCFVAGTEVTMNDNNIKTIEDISIGDMVKSYQSSLGIVDKEVTNVKTGTANNIIEISFDNGTVTKNTSNHRYYVFDKGWTSYNSELEVGDFTMDINKSKVKITDIKEIKGTHTIYNITVKDEHNYFANGMLVHNWK